jgi:hypothetical protein
VARLRALITAIDHYPDPRNNLNSCLNDAAAFTSFLRGLPFEEHDITTLLDEQATLANVRTALDDRFAGVTADDRVVWFNSSHGYQMAQGDSLEEVICLHDEFLPDDEVTDRALALPPGVLTCVFDSCFSGGMYKLAFSPTGDLEIARTKVFQPSPEQAEKDFVQTTATARRYKRYGRAPARSAVAVKAFLDQPRSGGALDPPLSKGDEDGQVRLNGLLLSACLEDETAAAGTARTNQLSAFTHALLDAAARLGADASAAALSTEAISVLKSLQFRQTATLQEPQEPLDLGSRAFVTFATPGTTPTTTPGGKGMTTTTTTGAAATAEDADKFWGIIAQVAASVLPQVVSAIAGNKDFQSGVAAASPAVQAAVDEETEKFLGGIVRAVARVVRRAAPIAAQVAAQALGGTKGVTALAAPTPDLSSLDAEEGEKFWGALAQALATTVPVIVNAIGGGKGFEPSTAPAATLADGGDPAEKTLADDLTRMLHEHFAQPSAVR